MSENAIIVQLRRHVDDHIERYQCYGVDGYGNQLPFVPEVALIEFWTVEKITTVLCHDDDLILQSPEVIMEHYIVVFSILVLTSKAAYVDLFMQLDLSDKCLPLESTPKSHRDSPYNDVFEGFMDLQWKFCPMSLYHPLGPKPSKRTLSPEIVLPILGKDKINPKANEDANTAVLYKAKLHRLSVQETVPVVFKEYLKANSESQRLFENEWAMYSHLREDSFDHIVRYYGSFSCLGRQTIVLEHAPGGDLLAFYRDRKLPQTDWHRKQFWQNIFGLLQGLVAIDDFTQHHVHSRETWHLRGTHQDIRPQNILLCGNPSDDDYSVPFKFADMGTAHIRKVKNEGINRPAVDQFGNGMYSAPEAYRDNGVATGIGHKSDVYSLGGILSETLIWAIWGERGREAYQSERVEATRKFRLKGGFHEGAFHDGDGLLHVVENWHKRAVELTDGKANALSQLILKSMLAADPDRRQTAAQVFKAFKALIPTLESDSLPQNYISQRRQGWPASPFSLAIRSQTTPAGPRNVDQSPTHISRGFSLFQANKPSIAPFFTHSPTFMEPSMSPLDTLTHENTDLIDALHINSQSDSQLGSRHESMGHGSKGKLPASASSPPSSNGPSINDTPAPKDHNDSYSLPIQTPNDLEDIGIQAKAGSSGVNGNPPIRRSEHLRNGESSRSTSATLHRVPSSYLRDSRTSQSYRPTTIRRDTSSDAAITIDQIYQKCMRPRRNVRHALSRSLPWNSDAENPLKQFPDLEEPLSRLRGEHGRNQIFIVDDSKSMKHHQEQTARTCRVLAKLLKKGGVDDDGEFELYFASKGPCHKVRDSTELQRLVDASPFSSPRCEMRAILDQVATKVIRENQMVSIYVLTNGHWNLQDPRDLCEVEKPIERIVKHMVKQDHQGNWAMIQFVGFYKDLHNEADRYGKARLKYLDDGLRLERDIDIVDTRNAKKDVTKILLGSFSTEADDSPSESDD